MRAGEGETGEGRQVREGFECARQTVTRKGREEKPTFSSRAVFKVFLLRIRFLLFFVFV